MQVVDVRCLNVTHLSGPSASCMLYQPQNNTSKNQKNVILQ